MKVVSIQFFLLITTASIYQVRPFQEGVSSTKAWTTASGSSSPLVDATPPEHSPREINDTTPSPIVSWSILLPLLSASCIMWVLRKQRLCCSDDTVLNDSLPTEIVVAKSMPKPSNKTDDIELQNVVGRRAPTETDDVNSSSMLNHSDWTEEEEAKETSFSWMEGSSTVNYLYMRD